MGGRKSHNPQGGSWQFEGRYNEKILVTVTETQCADLGGCESMWGYTNTQMPAHIFAWGGVSVITKLLLKSAFWVLYVVVCS